MPGSRRIQHCWPHTNGHHILLECLEYEAELLSQKQISRSKKSDLSLYVLAFSCHLSRSWGMWGMCKSHPSHRSLWKSASGDAQILFYAILYVCFTICWCLCMQSILIGRIDCHRAGPEQKQDWIKACPNRSFPEDSFSSKYSQAWSISWEVAIIRLICKWVALSVKLLRRSHTESIVSDVYWLAIP